MFPKDLKQQTKLGLLNARDPVPGIGTVLDKTKCCMVAVYDFAVDGGAIGTLSLLDDQGNPAILPAGAIVTNVVANVITAPTSAGLATVSLGTFASSSVTNLLGATAIASLTGFVAGVPVGTAATWVGPVPAGEGLQLRAAIAAFALTAGKIYFVVEYVVCKLT